MLKKFLYLTSLLAGMAVLSLFVLRSVYALSFFQGMKESANAAGWIDADDNSMAQVGEGMTFEAGYLFFKIGAVKFKVLGKTVYDGEPAYRLQAFIESYSGVPFVNLRAVYDTYADSESLMCLGTSNDVRDGKNWIFTKINFDYSKKIVDWSQSENGKMLREATVPLDKPYTDGVSFFYYLRRACSEAGGKRTNLDVPIIVDTVRSSVTMTINEKEEPCEVTAFKYPVESYRLSGHINFTGFFGITGDFVGWMSADPEAVPLRADVKVILGSVVVKLKSVNRVGWVPPRVAGK